MDGQIVVKEVAPFLKWAGGKRWLGEHHDRLFPSNFERYYEPFLGGGSTFFRLQPRSATLSDVNQELINAYEVIRDFPEDVNRGLSALDKTHSPSKYYELRSIVPTDVIERAVRFIYLNRTCWNGLYRVNRKGEFNVPIGTKVRVLLSSDDFLYVSSLLKRVTLACYDFRKSIARSRAGDFVYCDPPYTVQHDNNGFLKYNESIFSWDDQVRLASQLIDASARGVKFAVSNARHESILQLYEGFHIKELRRPSVISGKNHGRGFFSEVFITNY